MIARRMMPSVRLLTAAFHAPLRSSAAISGICWRRLISRAAKESRLFTRVADLLSADVQAGEDERQRGEEEQAGDGNPSGRRLGEHGERALRRGDGHERVKVMNDTHLLQQRRQQKVDPL